LKLRIVYQTDVRFVKRKLENELLKLSSVAVKAKADNCS